MRSLTIISGPDRGRRVEFDRELVIGRQNSDLVVSDEEMSRAHATVRPVRQGVEIEDLGSRNGTFVNGERISGAATMTANGTIKLGRTHFAVEVPAVRSATAADDATAASGVRPPELADATVVRQQPEPEPAAEATPPPDEPAPEPPVDASEAQDVRVPAAEVPAARVVPPTAGATDLTQVRKLPPPTAPEEVTRVRHRASPAAPAAPELSAAQAPVAPPGGSPGGFAGGGPPKLPPPVRLLMKSALGRRLLKVLVKFPAPARLPVLLLLVLFPFVLAASVLVLVL